ncbi:hypothetical protein IB244_20645 [Rhizobium sp. RHZ02]|uniref:hypothetical protein n=1 Tax=Rhizobium sp. RHZ02 TaxID=2769306 RepID=UPI001784DEE3|nr:hypothetical protein [Rhizobium sp. RHZ02]MBD9453930.1 hypothetical protein [Rhizobium sp. RHZ02]
MDALTTKLSSNPTIEIIPPLQVSRFSNFTTCLCCNRLRTPGEIDDDGCGICNECLEPNAERGDIPAFEVALAQLPAGYLEGNFKGRRWSVTVKRSADGRREWLFAEDLGGSDIVSFNLYRLENGRHTLRPCEMSQAKVVEFVIGFRPDTRSG